MRVGDYCYIKGISRDYGIGKITQLNSGYSSNGGELIDIQFKHSKHSVPKINVISSPNIIDLIQRGDFINGDQISAVEVSDIDGIKRAFNCEYETICYTNEIIKSVVTKEQFEAMQYNLESQV